MAVSPLHQSVVADQLVAAMPITQGATTSKVLVNNPLLRVVAFVMDAEQELTEHASPRAVVVNVNAGQLRFEVDGVSYLLTGGDTVYLAPLARHALVALTSCRFTLTMVDTAFEISAS